MTIENCPDCGGTHYGSVICPYKDTTLKRVISVEKTRQMLADYQATEISQETARELLQALADLADDAESHRDGDDRAITLDITCARARTAIARARAELEKGQKR